MIKKYKRIIILCTILIAIVVSLCFIPFDATKFIPKVEEQFATDLGIDVHIEKLVLRLGPSIKVKAPIVHLLYEDGQKFGQIDNVKIYIPWYSLFKNEFIAKKIKAAKFIIKVSSNDKYLNNIIEKLNQKEFRKIPNFYLKNYSYTYDDKQAGLCFKLAGKDLNITKNLNYKNFKISTIGEFYINEKSYLSYDISFNPQIEFEKASFKYEDLKNILYQLKALDFHSDLIADLKISQDASGNRIASGLINVDNISVDDKYNKLPKSFLYLTFLGDKVGVLSNFYTSQDKKVCVDGAFNISKKPSVDLKVKTDEIKLSELYKKLKLFIDMSYLNQITALDGKLKADFNLKGDLSKIKSSGYLQIDDAQMVVSGVRINKISSHIDFSNNIINISNAIGFIKNSPFFLKGKIDKTIDLEFVMDKVDLRHALPDNLGIKSGILSLVANFTGTFENIIHKENIKLDNFNLINNDLSLNINSFRFDSNHESSAYLHGITAKTSNVDLIKIPTLKLLIDKDIIKIPSTNIFMPNSKMQLTSEITEFNTKNLTFSFNLSGFVNSKDIKNLKQIEGIYPIKLMYGGTLQNQNLVLQIVMDKAIFFDEPTIINLNSKFDKNSVKIEDLSAVSFNGNLSDDFKSNIKGQKKVIVSGIIENLKQPEFKNLRIFIPQNINLSIKDTITQLKGDVFVNGNCVSPDIIGQISIKNLVNHSLQVSLNNALLDFNKNVVNINAPQIKFADSSLALTSTLSTDFSDNLTVKNLGIKSKYINADTLLMYKDVLNNPNLRLNISNGNLYSEKATMNLYGANLYLSALNTDFNLKDNILDFSNISSEMYNGKIAGNLVYNLKDETFVGKIQGRGMSAEPVFNIVSKNNDKLSGILDFDSELLGSLLSKESLNGKIKFIVHNGRMSSLGKLEHLLYAQNVVSDSMMRASLSSISRAIALKDTGLFKYLKGDVVLNNGIANINMLQSQGPLMSLFIKGRYNIVNDNAKLTVLGRISDEVISGLGAFGEFSFNKLMVMLSGDENLSNSVRTSDIEYLPQLQSKNTREFRALINGIIDKPSSVIMFNWISYTQKSYRQKDIPNSDVKVPDFVEALPY